MSIVENDPHDASLLLVDPINLKNIKEIPPDQASRAMLAYYMKGLGRDVRMILEPLYSQSALETDLRRFPPIAHLSEAQQDAVFKNMGALQLTYGCNGACKGCGFDALPGAREHIPFRILERIVDTYSHHLEKNQLFCYSASDPLDYRYTDPQTKKEYSYRDVERLFTEKTNYHPYVATVIPKGSEHIARSLAHINRVSVMPEHLQRIEKLHLRDWDNIAAQSHDGGILNIKVGNLSVLNAEKGNSNTERRIEEGIGCFNGMLLTPRGLYSVVQNPGMNSATPQKQFVIPFRGGNGEPPAVGQDVRTMLSHHMPQYFHTKRYRYNVLSNRVPVCNFCTINDPHGSGTLVVLWEGTKIFAICSPEEFFKKTRTSLEDQWIKERRMLTLEYNEWMRKLESLPNDDNVEHRRSLDVQRDYFHKVIEFMSDKQNAIIFLVRNILSIYT